MRASVVDVRLNAHYVDAFSAANRKTTSPENALLFLARQGADDVDHGGAVLLAETHLHECLVELGCAVEQRRRHADAVGEVADHAEVMPQSRHRALRREKTPLRHPGRADG